jgi:hypothetical protein
LRERERRQARKETKETTNRKDREKGDMFLTCLWCAGMAAEELFEGSGGFAESFLSDFPTSVPLLRMSVAGGDVGDIGLLLRFRGIETGAEGTEELIVGEIFGGDVALLGGRDDLERLSSITK